MTDLPFVTKSGIQANGIITTPTIIAAGTNMGHIDGTGLQIGGLGVNEKNGSHIKNDGHANWTVLQTGQLYGGTEWNIYGSQADGNCDLTSGTNLIKIKTGLLPQINWINDPIYIGTFGSYKITAINTTSPPSGYIATVTVSNWDNSAVSWSTNSIDNTWQYIITTSDGVCNINGANVSWVSGEKFIPFAGSYMDINGTRYWVNSATPSSLVLNASAGNYTNYTFRQKMDINQQISTLRIQMRGGGSEANWTHTARAGWGYDSVVGASGIGIAYPLAFGVGYLNSGRNQYLLSMFGGSNTQGYAGDGSVSIGGDARYGDDALRVIRNPAGQANRLEITSAPSGYKSGIMSRGADANVGFFIDMKGNTSFDLTAHNFGEYIFRAFTADQGAQNYIELWNGKNPYGPSIRARNGISGPVNMGFDAQDSGAFFFSNRNFSSTILTLNGETSPNSYLEINSGAKTYLTSKATGTNPAGMILSTSNNGIIELNAQTSIGGTVGNESVVVLKNSNNVNRMVLSGGPLGYGPSIFTTNGSTGDVPLSFTTQNGGAIYFSNYNFNSTIMTMNGISGANSYVEVLNGSQVARITSKSITSGGDSSLVLGRGNNGTVYLDYDPTASSNSRELSTTAWTRTNFATLSGANFTGNVSISSTTPAIIINKTSSSSFSSILGTFNYSTRWTLELGNSDSNFAISRFNDSGSYVDTPFQISRSSGSAVFNNDITTTGGGIRVGNGENQEKQLVFYNSSRYCYIALGANINPGVVSLQDLTGNYARWISDVAGNFTARGQVTGNSDVRLKTNISTIDNALDKVNSLRGVSYEMISDGDKRIGVIAQEVKEIIPEVVIENSDGNLSVAYGNLVGLLIEAIKELNQKIERLENNK